MLNSRALITSVSLRPAMRASYSTLLLEALKLSQMDCSISSSMGVVSLIPTPDPCFEYAYSTWRVPFYRWRLRLRSKGLADHGVC